MRPPESQEIEAEIRRTGADRQMRKDTERVLTVLLGLALALLALTAFALARAQQRIRLNEVANGTHETVSVVAMCVSNPDRSPVESIAEKQPPTPTSFAEIIRDNFPN